MSLCAAELNKSLAELEAGLSRAEADARAEAAILYRMVVDLSQQQARLTAAEGKVATLLASIFLHKRKRGALTGLNALC